MSQLLQSTKRRVRILSLGLAGLLLLWLPIEDASIRWVLFFAIDICVLAVWRVSLTRVFASNPYWLVYPLAGLLAGLAVLPVTLFLMAFKSGVHGHGAPDFTPAQVTAVFQLTPALAIAGFLVGSGACLWKKAKSL